ncbi:MAG: D-alanine--D-alanine ligase [Chloroflexi bacterium]|nr:D-alanine--D-alanine ligase [Chloroflexota bacterium]MCL5075646.1 D-alanine--D-alanine ligase [Chloroflexota bacterium]
MAKLRIGVIFGGRSSEHEISLLSAASVIKAIDPNKYDVVPIGITKEGRWLISGDPLKALLAGVTASGEDTALRADPTQRGMIIFETAKSGPTDQRIDVIFPILHGPYGEDGTVQGFLEMADVPYVGAGVLASAVAMDKAITKALFKERGLPVAQFIVVRRKEWQQNPTKIVECIEKTLGYPCFVKPTNLGSSVGVTKVHQREELVPAIDLAASYDRKILIEQAVVDCREIECSVLGNDDPIASIPGEIVPAREFYDYESKYVNERTQLIIPADLPEGIIREVQYLAIEAFKTLDCTGMARVDFLITKDGSKIYVNEVNTIPGFTAVSMYPKLWETSGINYRELIDRLIELAIERHTEKRQLMT